MEEKELINLKKNKIKNWFSNRENLIIIGIFLFAIIIRFYYFTITNGQPLWWDEADYMSAAKNYAGLIDYQLGGNRLPGFPLIMSVFFMLGIASETVIRFVGLLIPSLIVIFLVYFTIKEMYSDRKIAIISTLIMTVLWEHLFYSNRFMTENFALIFQFLAIFIFFKVYMKKEDIWFIKSKYSLVWVALLSLLVVYIRPGNAIFIPGMFLFFIIINKSRLFTKKNLILLAIFAALLIAPLFFTDFYQVAISSYYNPDNAVAWNNLTVFQGFYPSTISWLPSLLYYSFIFGILMLIVDLIIYHKSIQRFTNSSKNLWLKSDIFNLLILLSVMGYFIFILRSPSYEFRWFFPILLAMLTFTSKGVISISKYAGRAVKSKNIGIIIIIIILIPGIYSQVVQSDFNIKNRITSYQLVKDSGLWLKNNANPNDIIFSASQTQHSYYSERKVNSFYINGTNQNEQFFLDEVNKIKPKYLIVSIFEPGFQPQWALDIAQRYPDLLVPVQIYFQDEQQEQPSLIIYEFNL